MRYLGAFPSEKDIIKKILPEVRCRSWFAWCDALKHTKDRSHGLTD